MHASCLPFLFLPPAGGDFAVDERQSRNRATGTLLHYALRVSSFATFFLSSSIHWQTLSMSSRAIKFMPCLSRSLLSNGYILSHTTTSSLACTCTIELTISPSALVDTHMMCYYLCRCATARLTDRQSPCFGNWRIKRVLLRFSLLLLLSLFLYYYHYYYFPIRLSIFARALRLIR
jgi:hypothetical protein